MEVGITKVVPTSIGQMKTITTFLAVAAAVAIASCAGQAARQHILLPAMQKCWLVIRADVLRELDRLDDPTARAVLHQADRAVDTGDPAGMATVRWPLLEELAESSIVRRTESGELGPGVASSKRMLIADFKQDRLLYLRQVR